MINWMRIPLGLNGAWSQGVPRDQAIPPDWVDQIESLALYLDGKVYEFGGELLDSLQAIVDSAVDLLAADESLPIDLRRYIHDLLMSIRTALSHERVGLTFDFANAVRQLYVAFAAAELRSEKKSDFWSALGRRIVFDGASHAAVSGLTALATIAITAG
ncbi:hypothetical protein SRABI76_03561 [Microbacterium oxydans]|nr:hypothetical protein SRABI76_03561 [Microbacterium oxydans]